MLDHYVHNIVQHFDRLLFQLKIVEELGSYWDLSTKKLIFKRELQRENKLISYERVFKMLENDMHIAGIGKRFSSY